MDIKLLNDYILVKQAKAQDTGAMQLASATNELIGRGEVIRGNDELLGKTIYFEKSMGTEFEISGEKVKFVKLEDIM